MEIKPSTNLIKTNKNYDGNQLITLFFEINGFIKTEISCKLNELFKDVIKRVLNQNGISENNNILVIYKAQKMELNVPIGEYHFQNWDIITIIICDI